MPTPYELSNAEIQFSYECNFNYIFNTLKDLKKNYTVFMSIIICLRTVIRFQVFLSNTNDLHTFMWF